MRLIIFVIGLLASAQIAYGQAPCTAETDCTAAGDLAPYPGDCEKYYYCTAAGEYYPLALSCPSGQYFDTDDLVCTAETVPGKCTNACSGGSAGEVYCAYDCTGATDGDRIVDGSNNTIFYVCKGEAPGSPKQCTAGQCFDGTDCTSDTTKCCSQCQLPTCTAGKADLPTSQNPCDCTSYYVCGGTNLYQGQCPDGSYYDEDLGECFEGTCTPKCSNTLCGSTGSNPTDPPVTGGCADINTYTCIGTGPQAYCTDRCSQKYINCNGGNPTLTKCPGVTVFDPNTKQCVLAEDCSIKK